MCGPEGARHHHKRFFDDLGSRFYFKSSFGKFGILCVLGTFRNAELEQKMRPNRKRGVFGGAYIKKGTYPKISASRGENAKGSTNLFDRIKVWFLFEFRLRK